jgi:hypothetical protein
MNVFEYYALLVIALWINGCSLYLDPTVCESDADCGGGVCQVEIGVCIGPRVDTAGEVAMDMSSAGDDRPDVSDAGQMNVDMMIAGTQVNDMMTGGEGGSEVIDADVPQVFECQFDLDALSEQGARRRDLPPDLNGASSWVTSNDEVELRVTLLTPDNERWATLSRVYLGEESSELVADGSGWITRLTLTEQGERHVRLVVGDDQEVRCIDQFNLTVDREAPEISLISPMSADSWIGKLSGDPEVRLSLEGQDLTRINWRVEQGEQELAQESQVDSGDWSVDLALEEGINQFSLSATDELNQQSDLTVTLRYDPQPPGINVTSPSSDRLTVESPTFTFEGTVTERVGPNNMGGLGESETNARVIVTVLRGVDGSGEEVDRQLTRSGVNGEFSVTTNLEVGSQHVEICGYDQADNSSCSVVIMTRVEAEPCVNISSAHFSLSSEYQLIGDVCSSVESLTLSIDNATAVEIPLTDNTFNYSLAINEPGVEYQLTLTAVSVDGNTAVESTSVLWDESAPLVLITRPESGACLNDEMIQVCGRVIDEESGTSSVWLQGQPVDLSDQVEEGDPWWEDFCVEFTVNNGPLNLELRGENGATSESTSQVDVIVDRVAPSVDFPPSNSWYQADERGIVEIPGQLIISGCGLTGQGFKIYKLFEDIEGNFIRVRGEGGPRVPTGGKARNASAFPMR